jgi:hypothetical protein
VAPPPANWVIFDAEVETHGDSTVVDALDELAKKLRRDEIALIVDTGCGHASRHSSRMRQ